jgi:hypothetical protein
MSYNGGDELRRLKPMVRQTLDPIQINVGLCRWNDRFPESPEIRNLLFGPASCLAFHISLEAVDASFISASAATIIFLG